MICYLTPTNSMNNEQNDVHDPIIKIFRNKGGFAHNTGYKTRARSNRTGQTTGIEEPAIEKRMRRLIGAK